MENLLSKTPVKNIAKLSTRY